MKQAAAAHAEPPSSLSTHLGRLLALCVTLGVISGVGAIVFYWLMELVQWGTLERIAGYHPARPAHEPQLFGDIAGTLRPWALVAMPALGGLLSGWLVYRFAPEAAGHGSDAAIEAYHFRDGAVRGRVPFIKILASALTIGTGGSGGSEGPITQIGAGFGSFLAQKLNLSPVERRTLMAAGMAAGIAAIFRAPLAGALFAAEVLYKDLDVEHEVLIPAFISSTIAYSVFAMTFGWSPLFATPDFVFDNPARLLPYFVLALVEAAGAIAFIHLFYGVHDLFGKLRIPPRFKPAIGGALAGVVALWLPQTLGTSYGFIQTALTGQMGAGFLLAFAAAKMVSTSFSIGSGGSGGVFGPSVVIGGALGGAVGLLAQRLLPGIQINPGAFVIVGMAAFFSAAAKCPISTIILVSEVTGNYRLLVPSMFVCVIAYVVSKKHSLYRAQLGSRLDAPAKMGNMLSAVLRKISVRRALEAGVGGPMHAISESLTLADLIRRFSATDQGCFPIVDGDGRLAGVVDGSDIRRALQEQQEVADLVVARDLARPAVTITSDDSLLVAVSKLTIYDQNELVVVDPLDPMKPVGTLNRAGIVRAYDLDLPTAPTPLAT